MIDPTDPTNFAEGQRALAMKLAALAGIAIGVGLVGMVWIIWRGGWTEATEAQRLSILSIISIGGLFGMVSVIIGLLVGGPVGRLKGGLGKDGASLEMDDKD